jgi:hypothetical protein
MASIRIGQPVRKDVLVAPASLDSSAQRYRDRPARDPLTAREREVIQDWMARRFLQLHVKDVGRRRTDLPMPAVVKSASQAQRLALQTYASVTARRR